MRPWGWYEDLLEGPEYKLKRLWLNPGQRLSLQRHQHRSENWTVAEGEGTLLCGHLERGERRYNPAHPLRSNPSCESW